jgi:2OG-Fe(II) oxygenase superfamily
METIQLTDGGILLFDECFLPSELSDRYFVELRDNCVWEQKPGIFGQMQPRLTASYGDEGVTYRYSGTVNVALPWTPTLLKIKEKIEAVQGRYNYCLLNRYRSGQDSMGMHADDELEMGNAAKFATELRGSVFDLDDPEFRLLYRACEGHTHERTHPDVTIQTCWDADRLDLGRVGIMPHRDYLGTEVAKKPEIIKWADGQACFRVVQTFVLGEWGIDLEKEENW